jgi:hypothetical protein
MGPRRNIDILKDIKSLLNPSNEVEWHREGVFNQADSAGKHIVCPSRLTASFPLPTGDCAPYLGPLSGFASNLTTLPTNSPVDVSLFTCHLQTSSLQETGTLQRRGGHKVSVSDRQNDLHPKPSLIGNRKRAWKPNKRVRRMVLGDDVGLEETCKIALCGMVGRLAYSYLADRPISDWVLQNWAPILGYAPKILYLTKGWMGFICKSSEDVSLLLNKFWVLGRSSLMLKRRRVAFDPLT